MADRINFTLDALAKIKCPPDKDRIYVYDTKCAGLCVCVTRAGSRSYYLYKKLDGKPERMKLELPSNPSVEQIRTAFKKIDGEIASDRNPAEERRAQRAEMTLGDLFKSYMDKYARAHKKTWDEDQRMYDTYLSDWRNRRIGSIERKHVATLHVKLGTDHGNYQANRVLGMLSTVFNFAPDYGFTGGNPAKGVKRFKEHERERFIQADEMPRFLDALDKDESQFAADFFRLCLFTGARKGNVLSMAWSDINFGRRTWTIPHETTKNGEQLTLDLVDEAIEVLQRRWKAREDNHLYVFPGRGATGHLNEPKEPWKRICKRAKLDDLHIHDLRRTAGSWMAIRGTSLSMIGAALGHKSLRATAVYARLNRAAPAAAMQSAMAAISALAPVKPKIDEAKKTA